MYLKLIMGIVFHLGDMDTNVQIAMREEPLRFIH